MKTRQKIEILVLALFAGGAIATHLFPEITEGFFARFEPSGEMLGQYVSLVPGSVHDGDTLRVSDGNQEIKVRLCGIDAPEIEQALGVRSRDYLRSLIAQGSGRVIMVPVDTDQYGRTVAELFVPTGNGEEELHLNSQMVLDGMAYVYPQYVADCPNGAVMKTAQREATKSATGVWANPLSQKPWDYRRQSS